MCDGLEGGGSKGVLPVRVDCQPDPSQGVDKSPFHLGVTDLPSIRESGRFLPVPPRDLRGLSRENTQQVCTRSIKVGNMVPSQ